MSHATMTVELTQSVMLHGAAHPPGKRLVVPAATGQSMLDRGLAKKPSTGGEPKSAEPAREPRPEKSGGQKRNR